MKKTALLLILFLLFCFNAYGGGGADRSGQSAQDYEDNPWDNFASNIDDSFYFVIDKIVNLQGHFLKTAREIGYVVLLIAILTAALNYALTGTGLKENIIKIMKATLFFFIVIFCYPRIIGAITSWSMDMAMKSIYPSIDNHFKETVTEVEKITQANFDTKNSYLGAGGFNSSSAELIHELMRDNRNLFSGLTASRQANNGGGSTVPYAVVSPANALKIVFFLAGECVSFADNKNYSFLPEFSRILKGLICAFFLIFTGIFAILEYCICFLEFFLVSSVGVILFPLSLWDGSKFMAEKYVGAIAGFFIKLLFCTLAIFLMLYGFISLFYIINSSGFKGQTDQIVFIAFTSMLFFFICKSAPALAQSLLSGTPSLSASGAIGAVAGAVGAAASVAGYAKSAGGMAARAAGGTVGGLAKGGFALAGNISESNAAAKAVKAAGGTRSQQAGAWFSAGFRNIGDSINSGALGLTRSLLSDSKNGGSGGGWTNPHSWRHDFNNVAGKDGNQTVSEHFKKRRNEGTERGREYAKKHGLNP